MALALKFQGFLSRGTVRSHADLAELGHVSRTRVCQTVALVLSRSFAVAAPAE
jgi:hypothetical protein